MADYAATVAGAAGGCRVQAWREVPNKLWLKIFAESAPATIKAHADELNLDDRVIPRH